MVGPTNYIHGGTYIHVREEKYAFMVLKKYLIIFLQTSISISKIINFHFYVS